MSIGLFATLVPVIGLVTSLAGAQPAGPRSTLDGIYSEAQARRGEQYFTAECMDCHELAEFTGADALFREESGKPLWPIFDFMWTEMPEDEPAWLEPEVYADILAYLLRQFGMPPGGAELRPDPAFLRTVILEPPPNSGGS